MPLTAHHYNITHVDLRQPLKDTNNNGRQLPWKMHRENGELLAYAYDEINGSKAARLRACAPRLLYADVDGKLKLRNAWFCRVRLCPLCQWRRSLKIYGQAAKIIEAATQQSNEYGWIMLTLTVKNVDALDLSNEITLMGEAWHRLLKLRQWTKIVQGSMRSIEVTHNLDTSTASYDTYHPHFHVLLAVRKSYFKSRDYLNHAQWQALWQQAARLDYTPQVHVQRVKSSNAAALAEVAKYASKPSDYILPSDLDMMKQSVEVLDMALHRRRLVAWTGIMKDLHAQLKLDDAEDGDLIHTDGQTETGEAESYTAFSWLPEHRQYYREKDVNNNEESEATGNCSIYSFTHHESD